MTQGGLCPLQACEKASGSPVARDQAEKSHCLLIPHEKESIMELRSFLLNTNLQNSAVSFLIFEHGNFLVTPLIQ